MYNNFAEDGKCYEKNPNWIFWHHQFLQNNCFCHHNYCIIEKSIPDCNVFQNELSEVDKIQLNAEDEANSETATVVLPQKRVGNIHKVSCCYVIDGDISSSGFVKVEWSVFHTSDRKTPSALGIISYEVVWTEFPPEYDDVRSPGREQRIKVESHESHVLLPVTQMGLDFVLIQFLPERRKFQKIELPR